ncbi:hypothetical protein AB4Z32_02830 [Massilia sp. 2TAF26]
MPFRYSGWLSGQGEAMVELNPDVVRAIAARHEGRPEDALAILIGLFARVCKDEAFAGKNMFIVVFEWEMLAGEHGPARDALARARDAQARQLLDGDNIFRSGRGYPGTRFQLIAGINDTLKDPQSTVELFAHMEDTMPEDARHAAWTALPAMVAAGDFERAERYLPDPLARTGELNAMAASLPLFPPLGAAPRLAAELANAMKDVWLCASTFEGLGRGTEADELRGAALAGIESEEMRALAARELADPGTIFREIGEHQEAQEARAGRLHLVSNQNPPG